MKCSNCGMNLVGDENICSNCGRQLLNINENNNYQKNDKTKKVIIISLLLIVVILLAITSLLLINDNGNRRTLKDGSRTVMLYMVGSNLESESKIATYDLESIDVDKIDLDKMNILLYTGGTEEWHNFIKNDENGLYKLTEDGFEKIKSENKKNMGDADTLQEFLDYGYDNYETQYYDLILYNHGGAIQGAIYDDFTKDNLSLNDFSEALDNSKFNEKNKLNTILFRTCLNGTIEVANVFAPYANYLIASEEVTNGGDSSVLNFLNDVENTDDGIEYGKKFISSYERQIDELDPFGYGTMPMYSVIDLTKVKKVNELLDEFIEGIDLKENYGDIVRIRSNLYQYGYTSFAVKDYDTVDLYELIDKLGEYSKKDNKELLDAIEDAVIYNWSRQKESHGMSIYFPYNASNSIQKMFLKVYKGIDDNSPYYKFIGQFNSLSTSKKSSSFVQSNIVDNNYTINKNEFTLQLTEEQKKDYADSIYIVFRKVKEDGMYQPIYSSDNTEISDDGILKTNTANNLIKVHDISDSSESFLLLVERSKSGKKSLITNAVLEYASSENLSDWKITAVTASIDIIDEEPKITSYVQLDSENGVAGTIINPEEYTTASFVNSHYRILDEKGNYTDNWDNDGIINAFKLNIKDIKLKKSSLDDNEEYYCVFKIRDIYGNEYYSKLLNIK